jgi:hypothetical protein
MATYKANSTVSYLVIGNSWTNSAGYDTYGITRAFMRFDTSAITPDVANITAVDLVMNVEAVNFNSDSVTITSAISTDTNWGTALTAIVGDFASTNANWEDSVSCSTTGSKTFSIDKNNLDYSGTTWFRAAISNYEYAHAYNVNIRFSSQNHATQANRPKLVITYTEAGATYTQVLICTT